MAIKTRQIETEPRLLAGASAPTTGSGIGAFFALDIGAGETEAAFVDEAGNMTQLTNAGVIDISSAVLNDLSDVNAGAPLNGQALVWDNGTSKWIPGAGGGEVNTGSNLGGASDADVFKSKVGVDLQFRRLTAGANMTITENASDIVLASTATGGLGAEFKFVLPAAANIAARVAAAGGNPIITAAGPIAVYDGVDPSVDPVLGASTAPPDMVIDYSAIAPGTLPYLSTVMAVRTFPPGQIARIESSAPIGGQILSNDPLRTQVAIINFDVDVPTTDQAEIYIKIA